ncbi:hypoxia-inducible factor 3-alpha-like isoform X1 [Dinothrombium tinctorium]|uniref:Hypoxia-inducible factor 3-alpha-like isoform X1 n=1 Tax=Dinothrombium tinctorium TaxID=1965070 RepID=A0A3S3NZH7_9ACAR|nr:hypoxia-inducible factor 3-alpha-like isoform X1 [Dinothrombium tinctorium]
MANCLPIAANVTRHMDKASIMRLSIAYMKQKQVLQHLPVKDGEVIYVSETIEDYLGLKQLDIIGNSIYDYVHPCDHKEMKDAFNAKHSKLNHAEINDENEITFVTRIKCTFTEKGKCINLKSAAYKVYYDPKIISNRLNIV